MTKLATGVDLKRGQATRAIRGFCNDSIEAMVRQFMWIPSLMSIYTQDDASGTYILEHKPCSWDNSLKQFHQLYAAPSISKHLGENGQIGLVCCDGTFTKARGFNSIILIAVTFDGNDQSFILAFAVVGTENSENWT